MIKKRYVPLLAALLSSSAIANHGAQDKLLFVEAGLAFSHAFYKGSVVAPESINAANPFGFAFDPDNHYPNSFFGGYIGASLLSGCWLFNSRYDVYDSDSESHGSGTRIHFSPVRLSFTVDRVWGDVHDFSGGLGVGTVIENMNKGSSFYSGNDAGTETNHSLGGRTRIDPVLEAFVMKNVGQNVAVKLNVGYQLPAHNRTANGDVNVNLGLNYAFPV